MSASTKSRQGIEPDCPSLEGQIILLLLKVIQTACHEMGYVTLFNTVIETSGGSFSLSFNIYRKNDRHHSKKEILEHLSLLDVRIRSSVSTTTEVL